MPCSCARSRITATNLVAATETENRSGVCHGLGGGEGNGGAGGDVDDEEGKYAREICVLPISVWRHCLFIRLKSFLLR